jgi:hypothetical protein
VGRRQDLRFGQGGHHGRIAGDLAIGRVNRRRNPQVKIAAEGGVGEEGPEQLKLQTEIRWARGAVELERVPSDTEVKGARMPGADVAEALDAVSAKAAFKKEPGPKHRRPDPTGLHLPLPRPKPDADGDLILGEGGLLEVDHQPIGEGQANEIRVMQALPPNDGSRRAEGRIAPARRRPGGGLHRWSSLGLRPGPQDRLVADGLGRDENEDRRGGGVPARVEGVEDSSGIQLRKRF